MRPAPRRNAARQSRPDVLRGRDAPLLGHDRTRRTWASSPCGGWCSSTSRAVLLHGHTHLGYGARPRELALGRTRVIDVYGYVLLDL